jgi:hypothetical protein
MLAGVKFCTVKKCVALSSAVSGKTLTMGTTFPNFSSSNRQVLPIKRPGGLTVAGLQSQKRQKYAIIYKLNQNSMNGLSKRGKFVGVIGVIVIGGMFAVLEARDERAYLPVVGLPPLRFQAVTTNNAWLAFKLSASVAKTTENSSAKTPAGTTSANITNSVVVFHPASTAPANTNRPSTLPQIPANENNNPDAPVFSPNSSSAASDLLTVSPQMITEYLKPVQNQTNQTGATMFVPAEMQLAPPASKSPGESQATYKTQ